MRFIITGDLYVTPQKQLTSCRNFGSNAWKS